MKFKDALNAEEKKLFKDAIGKVKPMVQDRVHSVKRTSKQKTALTKQKDKKALAEFHFSDEFEPDLNNQGPIKYVRDDVDSFEAKNLRRGFYRPELI